MLGGIPYYPAYTPHFYTLQHLFQGGGACYQWVHKPELFFIDAMGAERCGAWLKIWRLLSSVIKVAVNVSGGEQTFPQIMADFSLSVH